MPQVRMGLPFAAAMGEPCPLSMQAGCSAAHQCPTGDGVFDEQQPARMDGAHSHF